MKRRLQYAMPRVPLKKLKKTTDGDTEQSWARRDAGERQPERATVEEEAPTREDLDVGVVRPELEHEETEFLNPNECVSSSDVVETEPCVVVVQADVHRPEFFTVGQNEAVGGEAESMSDIPVVNREEWSVDVGGNFSTKEQGFCRERAKRRTIGFGGKSTENYFQGKQREKGKLAKPPKPSRTSSSRRRKLFGEGEAANAEVNWGLDESSESEDGWDLDQGDIPLLRM